MALTGHHKCTPAIINDALTPAPPGSDRLFDIWDKKLSEFDEVCCPPYFFVWITTNRAYRGSIKWLYRPWLTHTATSAPE
jgi:hypothetical protein